MKQRICPQCSKDFNQRAKGKLCPHCFIAIEFVGNKASNTILLEEKKSSKTIINYMIERYIAYCRIKPDINYRAEIGIYYNLLTKCRRLVQVNNITVDIPYFIILMINKIYDDPSYNWIAKNFSSLSMITGKLFNRIARDVIKEEQDKEVLKNAEEERMKNIEVLENPYDIL